MLQNVYWHLINTIIYSKMFTQSILLKHHGKYTIPSVFSRDLILEGKNGGNACFGGGI